MEFWFKVELDLAVASWCVVHSVNLNSNWKVWKLQTFFLLVLGLMGYTSIILTGQKIYSSLVSDYIKVVY